MKHIEVTATIGDSDTIRAVAEQVGAIDCSTMLVDEDQRHLSRILVADDKLQKTLDSLQKIVSADPGASIVVLDVVAALPHPAKSSSTSSSKTLIARETLVEVMQSNSSIDRNYVVLVLLSTIVATIGLIENSVAVLIGAMVIAPLLGPNLSLSIATTLGDQHNALAAIRTLAAGLLLAIFCALFIGWAWPLEVNTIEILDRTHAGWNSIILALASGAAAALSLATGVSSTMVGVMVAVALLPPAATVGLTLAQGNLELANGAALLLAVNIICLNLASKLVFLVRGIHPRTFAAREKARRQMLLYIAGWLVGLGVISYLLIVGPASF